VRANFKENKEVGLQIRKVDGENICFYCFKSALPHHVTSNSLLSTASSFLHLSSQFLLPSIQKPIMRQFYNLFSQFYGIRLQIYDIPKETL